mgnify:CR=1 FL=1
MQGVRRQGPRESDRQHLRLGQLAAGIAHQINNPVGAIVVAGEYALAARDQVDAEAVHEQAGRSVTLLASADAVLAIQREEAREMAARVEGGK